MEKVKLMYSAPTAKIVAINIGGIICTSGADDGTEQYKENIDPDIF